MGKYSIKSDFPKTKSLNLYLFVSLPASLPRTDYAKLPLPAVREKTRPRLFLVRVCIDGSREAAKTQAVSCTPPSTLAFMNFVLPVADMWNV